LEKGLLAESLRPSKKIGDEGCGEDGNFVGLLVFGFIIEYSSLRDFCPYVDRSFFYMRIFERLYFSLC
jgi:hypothetical protein